MLERTVLIISSVKRFSLYISIKSIITYNNLVILIKYPVANENVSLENYVFFSVVLRIIKLKKQNKIIQPRK